MHIFLPMLVVVLITFVAFFRMGAARARAIKEGQDPNFYRAHLGPPEPEYATAATRHYGNLLEMPTLFYAGCLTAFVLGAVSGWVLIFAWGYVAGRIVQSAVHMTYNNPAHRGIGFVLSVLFMLALWIDLALEIFSRM
ncbi:MAG: MAPEG family protein [Novosphingobium sp.]|nr:MAPEG family protein [Novosphingobium sp.]